MLSPSAAPRWKMTTRRLLRVPSTAPNAARVRKLGTAAVPTTARALLRRNTRRVMDMMNLSSPLKLQLSAVCFQPAKLKAGSQGLSSSLKFGRTQQQAGDGVGIGRLGLRAFILRRAIL